jgi:uncharacterized protein (TIGR02996 family)
MREDSVLLADIRDNPNDLSLRLILADWLDDHGQTDRAEFIRLLCRSTDAGLSRGQREKMQSQASERFAGHVFEWLGMIPLGAVLWDRGLILLHFRTLAEFLNAPFEQWQRESSFAFVVGVHVDLLHFCLSPSNIESLAAYPYLDLVTSLSIREQHWTAANFTALFAHRDFPRLRSLSLFLNSLTQEQLQQLRSFPWFSRLTAYDLRSNSQQSDTPDLVRRSHDPAPVRFGWDVLKSNLRGDSLVKMMTETPDYPAPEEFRLNSHQLTDHGAKLLADWPSLGQVRRLDLQYNQVTATGVRALVESPHVCGLRTLNLSNNNLGDQGIQALTVFGHLTELKRLALRRTEFGSAGLEMLRGWSAFPQLTDPESVSTSRIDAPIIEHAIKGGATLVLRAMQHGWATETFTALAQARGLKELRIQGDAQTRITLAQIAALSRSQRLTGLRKLELRQVGLTDEYLEILLTSPIIRGLDTLLLSDNRLSDKTGVLIRDCDHLRNLRYLDLAGNPLGVGLLQLLPRLTCKCLDFGDNGLDVHATFELGVRAAREYVEVRSRNQGGAEIVSLAKYLTQKRGHGGGVAPVINRPLVLDVLAKCEDRVYLDDLEIVFNSKPEALLDSLEKITDLVNLRRFVVRKLKSPHTLRIVRLPWISSLHTLDFENSALPREVVDILIGLRSWRPTRVFLRDCVVDTESRNALYQRFGVAMRIMNTQTKK